MTGFPAPQRIATNGIELSVHIGGPEDGQPVLLVHGWPELGHSWKPVWEDLVAAGLRVIAPDLRGYGASDAPEGADNYAIDPLVADLTGLLDALGIEKAIWCGHDWGGIIVWHGAMLAADRVAGVIGVNTPHLPRASQPPIETFRELGGEDHYIVRFQEEGSERAFEGREDDFFAYIFGPPVPPAMIDKLYPEITHLVKNFASFEGRAEKRIVVPPEERAVYAEAYRKTGFTTTTHLYRNFDANWERMGGVDHRLAMPCLMVSADSDFALPPKLTRWMPALCKDLEMHVLEGCGHWTMWEKPKALAGLITDWAGRRF